MKHLSVAILLVSVFCFFVGCGQSDKNKSGVNRIGRVVPPSLAGIVQPKIYGDESMSHTRYKEQVDGSYITVTFSAMLKEEKATDENYIHRRVEEGLDVLRQDGKLDITVSQSENINNMPGWITHVTIQSPSEKAKEMTQLIYVDEEYEYHLTAMVSGTRISDHARAKAEERFTEAKQQILK